ncbi:HlyD family efflux transporter periplasmic adaptor subunit [Stappia sp. GBMRC 2046]|uniref:HlyD family efflux transporter periplasmic adaptor subunit n=1 Tax=Stappia sediminis TaxID=2692190 RepID=A0A7X3LWW3_9HYPH|nr:HlyD family efflux transporter periplasmic adaptor subunit [Stappia sediminis]MXN66548.1 HlyD family efflux transporter periplasmic adaptor subunit [Stappia sediminis]
MSEFFNSALAALAAIYASFFGTPEPVYNGYVEADFVYIAPSMPGKITDIKAEEGDAITEGQVLVILDDRTQRAAFEAAKARVAEARANLDNLQTGSREPELEVIRSSLARAQAERVLAKKTLDRSTSLLERELVAQATVDTHRADLDKIEAEIAELKARLQVAELPGRDAQLAAARAAVDAAVAETDRARSDLDDRVMASPVSGRVEDVLFYAGEFATAGAPVLSILPPNRRKVVFFLPEPERISFKLGDRLEVSCDGCPPGLEVAVTFVATDPQYTPPIIYSREERARLVFRAEAHIDGDSELMPGQPVSLVRKQ